MQVKDMMVREVKTCAPDDSLSHAAQLMWDHDCGVVPVVSGRRVLGMITDRDACMAAYTQDRRLSEIKVASAMSKRVHACRPTDDVKKVEEMMRSEQVRRLPVVDAGGDLVGILSINDLARQAANERPHRSKQVTMEEVGATLASLCAHRQPASEGLLARSSSLATKAGQAAREPVAARQAF